MQSGDTGGGGRPTQSGQYAVRENTTRTNRDYFLDGVELGNRPPRNPIGSVNEIKPRYVFSGKSPKAGERYRVALAVRQTVCADHRQLFVERIFRHRSG